MTCCVRVSPETATGGAIEFARDLIVIPARFGSSRLPGKPLRTIAGRSLLERVVSVARHAVDAVCDAEMLVATDDERIAAHARELGCEVAMTDPGITSGSGRAFAAAMQRATPPSVVVNLQGDAPFVAPEAIVALLNAARASTAAVVTPVTRLGWDDLDAMRAHKREAPFSGTTCIRAEDGRALWFSKAIIPAIRDEPRLRAAGTSSPVFRHVGLYAYRIDALARFHETPPSHYEMLEGLEQLRFLEMGFDILTVEIAPPIHAMSGIDTEADIAFAERLIAQHGDPHVT